MAFFPVLRSSIKGRRVARSMAATRTGLRQSLPTLSRSARPCTRDPARDLRRLRVRGRLLALGRHSSSQETVYLAASMLALGHHATLVLGREIAPTDGPARYISWVAVGDEVVSTGLPVTELYTPVARLPVST